MAKCKDCFHYEACSAFSKIINAAVDVETGCEHFKYRTEVVEVVRRWWKEYSHSALVNWKNGEPVWADRAVYRCSGCDFGTIIKHNYCPRCGAKMDGGDGR